MGFTSRVKQISNSVSTSNDNSAYENRPGVYKCKVTSVEESPAEHTGAPYLLFKMRTEENKMISAKLWVARETDDESKANNKDNRIKKVFEALGVDMSGKEANAIIQEALGKEANFAFQSREYIGKNKDNNKPEIKTVLNYYYANSLEKEIKPLNEDNCIQRLSNADEREFASRLEIWNKQNKKPASTKAKKEESDDGLPF